MTNFTHCEKDLRSNALVFWDIDINIPKLEAGDENYREKNIFTLLFTQETLYHNVYKVSGSKNCL